MKPVDINPSMYIDFNKENNKEGPKLKFGDNVISKYINIFAKGSVPDWSEGVFVIKELKTLCCGHMLLVTLTEKKLVGRFTKKELQKTNQKEFRVEKAIKKKSINYVKLKGYNISFNS